MKTVPGIGMSSAARGTVIKCKCGSSLTTIGPDDAIYKTASAPPGSKLEEFTCPGCGEKSVLAVARNRT